MSLLETLGVTVDIEDERYAGTPIGMNFHGQLRPAQETAAPAMLAEDSGLLSAATAFGKCRGGCLDISWQLARKAAFPYLFGFSLLVSTCINLLNQHKKAEAKASASPDQTRNLPNSDVV